MNILPRTLSGLSAKPPCVQFPIRGWPSTLLYVDCSSNGEYSYAARERRGNGDDAACLGDRSHSLSGIPSNQPALRTEEDDREKQKSARGKLKFLRAPRAAPPLGPLSTLQALVRPCSGPCSLRRDASRAAFNHHPIPAYIDYWFEHILQASQCLMRSHKVCNRHMQSGMNGKG